MSDMKITVNGKPIGEYVKEKQEEEFLKRTYSFDVRTTIAEKEEDFILERIINSDFGFGYKEEQKLSKKRVRRALNLLLAEDEGRITERRKGRYEFRKNEVGRIQVVCPFCGKVFFGGGSVLHEDGREENCTMDETVRDWNDWKEIHVKYCDECGAELVEEGAEE